MVFILPKHCVAYRSLSRKLNDDVEMYKNQLRNLELANKEIIENFSQNEKLAFLKSALNQLKFLEFNEIDETKINKKFRECFD